MGLRLACGGGLVVGVEPMGQRGGGVRVSVPPRRDALLPVSSAALASWRSGGW